MAATSSETVHQKADFAVNQTTFQVMWSMCIMSNWTKIFKDCWCIFTLCAQSYSTTLQYVAIFCNILHKRYYWCVKKSAILIIAYPCIAILAIYWNIAQP